MNPYTNALWLAPLALLLDADCFYVLMAQLLILAAWFDAADPPRRELGA